MVKKTGSSQGILNSEFLAHYAIDYAAIELGPDSQFIVYCLVLNAVSPVGHVARRTSQLLNS